MIFVDSNIPMYLVGGAHPNKLGSQVLLEDAVVAGRRLVTDAEVLQEICHRFAAIGRREAIQPAYDAILGLVDEVLPVDREIAESAKDLLLRYPSLSARDAVHAATMRRAEIRNIMTFDRGFDALPWVDRIS